MVQIKKITRCDKRKGSEYYLHYRCEDVISMDEFVDQLQLILSRQTCGKEVLLPQEGGVVVVMNVSSIDRITLTFKEVESNE